jgi:hypothetical protein
MHSAFDGSVPETLSDVPGNVPEDSPNERTETFLSGDEEVSGDRSPPSPRIRWNVWTGFL